MSANTIVKSHYVIDFLCFAVRKPSTDVSILTLDPRTANNKLLLLISYFCGTQFQGLKTG